MIILVLGGARSGKSRYAIKYAESLSNFFDFYYIATAQAMDEEMKNRIKRHKKERGDKWKLIEEPLDLCEVLKKLKKNSVALIDCLTLWITNLMMKNYSLEESFKKFLQELKTFKNRPDIYIICVANEVGLGIVPDSYLGRKFRDYAGFLNQKIAELADEVYFVVAGYPLILKGIKDS
ncbi:MAG: bifunctional adenosylcobinamide kinase/adenosylcobinamide-phosphate guanylyltransferase [Thermodesulfobacteriota bacterium]|nr:MAG: bifunctional adenosylcobinamide kinase/adenosylcobinamide-phosphate guanylyltransferase [Thermodesulfobacteriota bacterium]